ncbi:MAG: universal stress protein, partial [candidate division NC10 bacterium]|nr:universal stress protein [candidate division NC10 bacterium]
LKTTLLAGKAFERILHHVRKTEPWLLVIGRIGIHSGESETDLGSNAENLLRLAPCHVYLCGRKFDPPTAEGDAQAPSGAGRLHRQPKARRLPGLFPPGEVRRSGLCVLPFLLRVGGEGRPD